MSATSSRPRRLRMRLRWTLGALLLLIATCALEMSAYRTYRYFASLPCPTLRAQGPFARRSDCKACHDAVPSLTQAEVPLRELAAALKSPNSCTSARGRTDCAACHAAPSAQVRSLNGFLKSTQ